MAWDGAVLVATMLPGTLLGVVGPLEMEAIWVHCRRMGARAGHVAGGSGCWEGLRYICRAWRFRGAPGAAAEGVPLQPRVREFTSSRLDW